MGFDAWINVYPRYKNYTIEDIETVEKYFNYEKSEGLQKAYTLEQYLEGKTVDKDAVEFYRNFLHNESEFLRNVIYKEKASWCSNGTRLYHIIENYKYGDSARDTPTEFELTKDDLIHIINKCVKNFKDISVPKDCYINNAFRDVQQCDYYDGESIIFENDGDPKRIMYPCDGVVLTDRDGNEHTKYTSECAYDGEFWLTVMSSDEDDYINYMGYLVALVECLTTVDFEKEMVVYGGGW